MNTENLTPDQFTLLLRKFNKLVENMPPLDKIKTKLLEIKQEAINNHELNGRQREAITARCDNYIKGEYGSTSRKHLLNGQPLK